LAAFPQETLKDRARGFIRFIAALTVLPIIMQTAMATAEAKHPATAVHLTAVDAIIEQAITMPPFPVRFSSSDTTAG